MSIRNFLLVQVLCAVSFAQTLTITGLPAVAAGSSTNVSISASGLTGKNIAAIMWGFSLPPGVSIGSSTVNPSLAGSGLQALCGPLGCIVVDPLPPNVIGIPVLADGSIMTVQVSVASTATPGLVTFGLTAINAADSGGLNVNGLTATPPMSIRIISRCDLNGDGTTNLADVMLVIDGAIGTGDCPAAISRGCDSISVMAEILAALGGTCKL